MMRMPILPRPLLWMTGSGKIKLKLAVGAETNPAARIFSIAVSGYKIGGEG